LEEEGEKNRAAAVTVKIANDVAIYVLNQKRHELTRIETEHGMEIFFEPKEGLAAGTFELERTKTRDPGERPRSNAAVSIEAGFVPSTEPEPDFEEETDEEEREEIEAQASQDDGEESSEPRSFDRPEGPRESSEGGRRRRRRGGRGRNRDRGERPEGQHQQQPVKTAEGSAVEGAPQGEDQANEQFADGQNEAPGQANGQTGGQQAGENGEARRRRRRRRGRRGGRDRGPHGDSVPQGEGTEPQQAGFVSAADRFGAVPHEIDTTPSDDKHAPAPTVPSWTPTDDIPDTTPSDESSKPAKKGWWQRTFSGE